MNENPHACEEQAEHLRQRFSRYVRPEGLLAAFPIAAGMKGKHTWRIDAAYDPKAPEITVRAEIVLRFQRTPCPARTNGEDEAPAITGTA